MNVYSSENTKVLILQKIYILKFVKGFCTWWNFCHFIGGGYGGVIITHRLKNDDSGVWGSSSIFSPLIYFSFTEKKKHKSAHEKEKTYR